MFVTKIKNNRINQDFYFHRSKKDGYRSRASYKLIQINKQYNILKSGLNVIDLGAAPGGWSQVTRNIIGNNGQLISVDILNIQTIPNVHIIKGDFTNTEVFNKIIKIVKNINIDLIISDMSPNLTGIRSVDQISSIYLCELALLLVSKVLRPGGDFLIKIFQGDCLAEYVSKTKQLFEIVRMRKPLASRIHSREQYMLARGFRT